MGWGVGGGLWMRCACSPGSGPVCNVVMRMSTVVLHAGTGPDPLPRCVDCHGDREAFWGGRGRGWVGGGGVLSFPANSCGVLNLAEHQLADAAVVGGALIG